MGFLLCVISTLVVLVSTAVALVSQKHDPKKIFGVYSQPGKWFYLKYYVFLAFLYVRELFSGLRKADSTNSGSKIQGEESDALDLWKALPADSKAFDAVSFQAVDNANGYYLCGEVERRHQKDKTNGVFCIVVPKVGLLQSKHFPKTSVDKTIPSKENAFEDGGIHMSMIEPMKKWKISYNGDMWLDSKTNLLEVELNAEWTSNYPHFMFPTDMDKGLIAEAIARERWSKELFENLKAAHQTHYEQMGNLNGTLKVNGVLHKLEMASFRHRSFGNRRDWTLMHRYAFHTMFLDDNTRICVGVVSQPCTTSHLAMGYLVTSKRKIHRITSCNLRLFEHGENGSPPKDIAFSITANFKRYDCSIRTLHECEHFKGNKVEARLLTRFTMCRVNGTKGKGIAEWHYNNAENVKV